MKDVTNDDMLWGAVVSFDPEISDGETQHELCHVIDM